MAEVMASGGACILMHNRSAEEAGIGDVMVAIQTFLQLQSISLKLLVCAMMPSY